jgi:hypothetical protein
MIVRNPDSLADERGERFGNPVRSLQVEMNDLKIRVPKQAAKFRDIGWGPFLTRERMHRDSDGFERFSKWPPAVHDRDLHVKRGPVAVSKHVQKRRLRPAEIEMIDDVQDADHHGKSSRKAAMFASLSCHARTKRAHSSWAAIRRFGFSSNSAAPSTRRRKSPDAYSPALKVRNMASGFTTRDKMAA